MDHRHQEVERTAEKDFFLRRLRSILGVGVMIGGALLQACGADVAVAQESVMQSNKGFAIKPWWKGAVIYEIYPRSFQDSNGDGIGDLRGVEKRLDYLKSLGVDAIWLTPIYPSPQVDFGYDISNYEDIDPKFGTLADFDRLVAEAKKRDIRIIMDLVLNHTSDQHPWFIESESSRTNPKRNWYIWHDGKGAGTPPNNWPSTFGHSSWKYDPKTGQYFYHAYYAEQPDLNWRNPDVQKAMFDVVRFWLDRGVAGFRLDAVSALFEDEQLRDGEKQPGTDVYGDVNISLARTRNLPEVHQVMRDLRILVDTYAGDRVLIGETHVPNVGELRKWYGDHDDELQLPMDLQIGFLNKLDVRRFRSAIDEAEHGLGDNELLLVFNNHDTPMSRDRYGDGFHDLDISRILSAILLGTRATAMIYEGEEIGMKTTPPVRIEDVRDPIGRTGWPREKGRDGERTPMQWSDGPNAGFTGQSVVPWLPIPPTYKSVNVANELPKKYSLLNWYKQWIALRRMNPSLREGTLAMVDTDDPNVLSWVRQAPGASPVLVICNFTSKPQTLTMDLSKQHVSGHNLKMLMRSPGMPVFKSLQTIHLSPFGVYVGEVK